jgi:hypothetical protein
MNDIVEKLRSEAALDVVMLKGLMAILWVSGHWAPSVSQYCKGD